MKRKKMKAKKINKNTLCVNKGSTSFYLSKFIKKLSFTSNSIEYEKTT